LGILDKPALQHWAWKMGLEGKDYKKVRDAAGRIGTLAHHMAECDLRGDKADTSDYSENEIKAAENAMLKFYNYRDEHELVALMLEEPMVSEVYRYGGTIDFYGFRDNTLAQIDLKTGGGIYREARAQVAAYRQLLFEAGHDVQETYILRIGRDESEEFEEEKVLNLDGYFEFFLACLDAYRKAKGLK